MMRGRRVVFRTLTIAAAMMVAAMPAQPIVAQTPNPGIPEELMNHLMAGEDRALIAPIRRAIAEQDPMASVQKLDSVIALIDRNSPMHVFLSAYRASRTVSAGNVADGTRAFETLVGRHPKLIPLKLMAIQSLSYTSSAHLAAEYWIDLAARNPQLARKVPGYTLNALAGNLGAQGDIDGKAALYLALDRIGYDPGSVVLRDQMQRAIFVNAANDQGRDDQAIAALNKIVDPGDLIVIASQAQYRRFWPHIALDTASLTTRGNRHLSALQADFLAADNGLTAGRFLRAAASFGDPAEVAREYTGLLERMPQAEGQNRYADFDTPFWVPPIAMAWLAADDAGQAEALFQRSLERYSETAGTNKLNITANYALLLLDLERPRDALALIEPSIKQLSAVDQSLGAQAQMHGVRLQAYHMLDRPRAAADSRRFLETVRMSQLATYAQTMLAIGEFEGAKSAVIASLRSREPGQAIGLLQHPIETFGTEREAARDALIDSLRNDPQVLAALDGVGRILTIAPIELDSPDHTVIARQFTLIDR